MKSIFNFSAQIKFLFISVFVFQIVQANCQTPTFGPEKLVTINGLTFDAMEPFISSDGQTLFFNSLNSGGNTNLYYATKIDDTTFNYVGLLGGTYDPTVGHLDGVASLDIDDRFFWVSLRNYPIQFENLHNGDYASGNVSNIKRTYGDFNIYMPNWLIMDAAIDHDGDLLYYVNANFNGCDPVPCYAFIGVAQKVDDTTFNKLPNTNGIFTNVNDTSNYITYAPELSIDGKELYFTRILNGSFNSEICVSVRPTVADTFGLPTVIHSNLGFLPEAATITDDQLKIYYHQKNALGIFEIYLRYRDTFVELSEQDNEFNFSVFPNPTNDVLNLRISNGDFTTEILSADGKLICSSENEHQLDISFLPKGIYFVCVKQNGSCCTERFVKE